MSLYCSAERGGENRNEKRDCAKQPPPLPSGKWVSAWRVRQETVSLVHLKLHSYGGKVRPEIQRDTWRTAQKGREVCCSAVRDWCSSICDTPTHYVSMGSKNGGGVEAEEERRWMLTYALWWKILLLRSQACLFRSSVCDACNAWSLNLFYWRLHLMQSCNIRYFVEWKWMCCIFLIGLTYSKKCYLFL